MCTIFPSPTLQHDYGINSSPQWASATREGEVSGIPCSVKGEARCVLAQSLFNTCMDSILDKVADQRSCGSSVATSEFINLVFAAADGLLAESPEILVMPLEVLHEEANPLGVKVSCTQSKVQLFPGLLNDKVQFVNACGDDTRITNSFTNLGSVVNSNGGSCQEVIRRIGLSHGIMLSTRIYG